MLTAVVIREDRNHPNLVELPLGPGNRTDSEGFRGLFLKDAEGLGPVEAELHRSDYANVSGVAYSGYSVGERNVVLTIGMDYTGQNGGSVQDIRRRLYQLVRPGASVRVGLEFRETAANLFFTAYVESMEPALFSKDPAVQVSMISMESYMEGQESSPVEGVFNPGGNVNSALIQYEGDAPAGFTIHLTNNSGSNISSISLRDRTRDTFFTLSSIDFRRNYSLHITTIPGRRTAILRNSSGSFSDRLYGSIHNNSTWPLLHYGDNRIGVLASTSDIGYRIDYRELYLGV